MNVTIEGGEIFRVTFSDGKQIELNWTQWMELRSLQNSLIYTEPKTAPKAPCQGVCHSRGMNAVACGCPCAPSYH